MFTPIKNLITYIQKNASGGSSSIFGGSNTCTKKMETETLKPQSNICINLPKIIEKQTSNDNNEEGLPIETESSKASIKPSAETVTTASLLSTSKITSETYSISSLTRTSPRKVSAMASATAAATSIVVDVDDIEDQLDTSIMLKKPVKRARTNDSTILEVKKSLQSKGRSICISHDYNRNYAVSLPSDDELEDFRYDPTVAPPSSPLLNNSGVEQDAIHLEDEGDDRSKCDLSTDDARIIDDATECVEDHFADCEGDEEDHRNDLADNIHEAEFLTDDELEAKSITKRAESETENSEYEIEEIHENGVEENCIELNSFPDCEVIVISETGANQNATSVSLDVTTSDDPLAIACEEQEAFSADRTAALEELNLLNSSNNSQDEDTQTTADEDLQWLPVDASATEENEQPSCSKTSAVNNSLGSIGTTPEKEERNGEGSDSGLGSETSALHITNSSLGDNSQLNLTSPEALATSQAPQNEQKSKCSEKDSSQIANLHDLSNNKSPLKDSPKPLRSNLKRRLEVGEDVVDSLSKITSSGTSSSLVTTSSSSLSGSVQKKPKRSINFDNVQVFYFPRQQGFGCVPSAGGCTLGMGARHVAFKTLSLAEHAAELRRAHRMQLQEINPRGSSSDDSEESEEDYLSEGSGSDLDGESNGFLQPVSPKQRRAILKAAGVRKIDTTEKAECRDIRNSREVCGCSCREFCDPETCTCSQSGIKCQVDRDMFPCGCSRDACGNTIGRVEFNPARVRTHFIHTLMRLEMENRQLQNPYSPAVAVQSAVTSATVSFYQSAHLQPQSNYSSGYASPAYNSSSAAAMHSQTPVNSSFYHQQTLPTDGGLYGAGIVGVNASTSQSPGVSGVTTPYGMVDSLDSGLFGSGAAGATPSYGELMPVPSYHHNINYGNVTTAQVPTYNSYHSNNTVYINAADETTTAPTTYSSCAVPSLPPYGTATTTEATTGNYHCVNSLRTLETTTAPSCSTVTEEFLDVDGDSDGNGSSFISLSTPIASSSRLSQINDLLQHNRNATTALIAVSQSVGNTKSAAETSTSIDNDGSGDGVNYQMTNPSSSANSTSTTKSIDTPPIEDVNKSSLTYVALTAPPPLRPAPIVAVVDISDASNKSPEDTTPTSPSSTLGETNAPTIEISSSTETKTSTSSPTMPILNSEIFSAPSTSTANLNPSPTEGEKPVETTAPNIPNVADLPVAEVLAGN